MIPQFSQGLHPHWMCLFLGSPTFIWPQVCWAGGQHPPLYEGGLWAMVAACWVPIPSPWRVPSSSSKLASMPPVGNLQWSKGGPIGDLVKSFCAASCQRSSINFLNWASPRSLRTIWNWGRGLSSGRGLLGRLGNHLPTLGWGMGAGGVSAPCSYIISEMGVSGRMGT